MKEEVLIDNFITSRKYQTIKEKSLTGPNGWLLFVACNSGINFAKSIKEQYERLYYLNERKPIDIPLIGTEDEKLTRVFTDTETCPRLPIHVAGADAYVFQCVHENISDNTVNENIQQLLQVIRTLRAHRARTITVVCPYSPYSRQDKPSFMKREAALASLFADQLKVAGADIFLTYHPHTLSLYGFYEPEIKFVALSALDLFEEYFSKYKNRNDVIVVSTDAGGAKATIHFSEKMNTSYAISSKFRRGKDQSNILGTIGDFDDKKVAIITDDETVTGSSIINAVKSLYQSGSVSEINAAVAHYKINREHIGKFIEAHEKYGLKELFITDTIPQLDEIIALDFVKVRSLSDVFAATINKLRYNQSVSHIFSRL